jgi:hypothetical protein
MGRKHSYVTLAATVLSMSLISGCADNPSTSANEEKSLTIEQLDARAKAHPDSTDNEIAWFLSLGREPITYRNNDKRPSHVVMWQGPMRVSIEDVLGKDLDLSTYPGSVMKYYLTSLAEYTKLPITITQAARHDNNVSIVVSKARLTGDAGTIYGVPELSDRPHKWMSGILQDYYLPRYGTTSREEHNAGEFSSGYVNKACSLNVVIPDNSPEDPEFIFNLTGGLIGLCFGPDNTGIGFPDAQPKIVLEWEKHTFFFWKTLYHSGIKPGMSQPEAYRKLIDYLKHSQS